MKTSEIIQNFFRALEQKDFTVAEGYLAYDFILSGPTSSPLGKRDYMNFVQALLSGFPDWSFNTRDIRATGDQAAFVRQISGTNTRDIPPLFSGMPPTKATGKRVQLPEESGTVTLRGDKIVEIQVEKIPGGGVEGLLEQLGVQLPVGLETPIVTPVTPHR